MTNDIDRDAFEAAYVARARSLGVELDTNPEYMRGLRVGETYGDRPYLNGMYDGWTLRGDTAEKQRDAANAALEVTGENMRLAEKQRDAAYAALDAVIEYAKGWGNQPAWQELEALLLKHGVHARAPKPIRVDHYTHVNLHIDTEEWQKTRESYEVQGAAVTDLLITIDGESFEVSHGELLYMLRTAHAAARVTSGAFHNDSAEGVREFIYRGVCMTCKEKIRDDSGVGYICGCTRV
jgi:hypothetical protein